MCVVWVHANLVPSCVLRIIHSSVIVLSEGVMLHTFKLIDFHEHTEAKRRLQNVIHVALTVSARLSIIKYRCVHTHMWTPRFGNICWMPI